MINSMEKIYKSRKYDRACSSDIREFSSYFIKKNVYFICLEIREKGREIFRLLVYFSNTQQPGLWQAEARNFIQICHLGTWAQCSLTIFSASQDGLAGSWIRNRISGTQTSLFDVGCWHDGSQKLNQWTAVNPHASLRNFKLGGQGKSHWADDRWATGVRKVHVYLQKTAGGNPPMGKCCFLTTEGVWCAKEGKSKGGIGNCEPWLVMSLIIGGSESHLMNFSFLVQRNGNSTDTEQRKDMDWSVV